MAEELRNGGYQFGKLEGKVEASFQFNDREHQMLFDAIKDVQTDITTVCKDVVNLKIKSAMFGAISGVGGAVLAFLGKALFVHVSK